DFRNHMDRLIGAIERAAAADAGATPSRSTFGRTQDAVAETETTANKLWLTDLLRYFLIPLILLLVAHHVIVNVLNLDTTYLWIACALAPLTSGFALFWLGGRGAGAAFSFAIALGTIGVVGMTLSQSLNSGDPIMPQTRYEWWDNINFAAVIALSFIVGHALARASRAVQ